MRDNPGSLPSKPRTNTYQEGYCRISETKGHPAEKQMRRPTGAHALTRIAKSIWGGEREGEEREGEADAARTHTRTHAHRHGTQTPSTRRNIPRNAKLLRASKSPKSLCYRAPTSAHLVLQDARLEGISGASVFHCNPMPVWLHCRARSCAACQSLAPVVFPWRAHISPPSPAAWPGPATPAPSWRQRETDSANAHMQRRCKAATRERS